MVHSKRSIVLGLVMGGFLAAGVQAADITWLNSFTFYGDNTEFFEPFRTGETLLGQQGQSRFQAALGQRTFLSVGVFGDFRSTSDV
ncbi:MAG TPA: hypothetical protein VJ873_05340, partial [bacterium]|nr:hypothetical protein [bacterium]